LLPGRTMKPYCFCYSLTATTNLVVYLSVSTLTF
jgi:hypothetical protein